MLLVRQALRHATIVLRIDVLVKPMGGVIRMTVGVIKSAQASGIAAQ